MKSYLKFIAFIVMLSISISSIAVLGIVLHHDMQQYKAEGVCIAQFIAQGVERKDIKTHDGSCSVITYGEPVIINPQPNVNYD